MQSTIPDIISEEGEQSEALSENIGPFMTDTMVSVDVNESIV